MGDSHSIAKPFLLLSSQNESLPDFHRHAEDRRNFEAPCRFPFYTGNIEGCGLHFEMRQKDWGLYEKPSDRMGRLSCDALRACRWVVDTGMHSMVISLDRAHQYTNDDTAIGEHHSRTEVIRYVTCPGQATAHKVGERFIHRLREEAEERLYADFDPRDFYHVVLKAGPVPLGVLEEMVDAYIDWPCYNQGGETDSSNVIPGSVSRGIEFLESMSFAKWCKCFVVPSANFQSGRQIVNAMKHMKHIYDNKRQFRDQFIRLVLVRCVLVPTMSFSQN